MVKCGEMGEPLFYNHVIQDWFGQELSVNAKSRGENLVSRICTWSLKCLLTDCTHAVEKLGNTLTEDVKLTSPARTETSGCSIWKDTLALL